jgi:excisionase family DNA binding protein
LDRLYKYDDAAAYLETTRLGIRHLVQLGKLGYTPVSPNGRLRRISGRQIIEYLRREAVDPKVA